jgi:hypothetical protein
MTPGIKHPAEEKGVKSLNGDIEYLRVRQKNAGLAGGR